MDTLMGYNRPALWLIGFIVFISRNKPYISKEFASFMENDTRFFNQKELRVIGLSRSGNHAIINWILNQAQGRTCFLNCVEGKTNPFVSARPLASGLPYEANYPEFDWERECCGDFLHKDLLVYSYEDSFLGHTCHPLFEQHHDRWMGPSRQRMDILILRDPFNLFASRRRAELSSVSTLTAIRIWKQHAREALGERHYLNTPNLWIYYNRWVTDRAYRQQIATRLGLRFSDATIDTVHSTGGGSSFDGVRYNGAARQMKVLERWKVYQHDPAYVRIFDPELVMLSRRIALLAARPVAGEAARGCAGGMESPVYQMAAEEVGSVIPPFARMMIDPVGLSS